MLTEDATHMLHSLKDASHMLHSLEDATHMLHSLEDASHILHSLENANLWERTTSQGKRTTEAKAGPQSVFWIKQEIFLVMYSKSLRQNNLFYWRESSADIMPNIRNIKYHITLTFQCGFFLRLEDTIETNHTKFFTHSAFCISLFNEYN